MVQHRAATSTDGFHMKKSWTNEFGRVRGIGASCKTWKYRRQDVSNASRHLAALANQQTQPLSDNQTLHFIWFWFHAKQKNFSGFYHRQVRFIQMTLGCEDAGCRWKGPCQTD
ncbi:hypothetical protein OUZ56_017653 [Daphnia magna]|uniref:Uncharacterized protein n=1 Tax=Daphnia magna TaxID=35525 RepID=A0ABR0ATD1_9CRUS|nr:hypothetical protein OUZ56_017653 [Daphnia magna]